MGYQPRILEKFESDGGAISYDFPLAEYEWESSQDLRVPESQLVGAHYAYDRLGAMPGLKTSAIEHLRAVILEATPTALDTKVDETLSELFRIGRGKLWTIDNAGVRRWAWARLLNMPTMSWRAGQIVSKGAAFEFRRQSDWYGESLVTDTETVTADGQSLTVANSGNLPVLAMTVRLRANAAAGFTNPKLTNNTSNPAYVFETLRDSASVNSEVRLRTDVPDVGYSNDDGVSYVDDFANLVLPTSHQPLAFILLPGNNTIIANCGGTPNFDVTFTFYPAWA